MLQGTYVESYASFVTAGLGYMREVLMVVVDSKGG
jgi:hypothetical protein